MHLYLYNFNCQLLPHTYAHTHTQTTNISNAINSIIVLWYLVCCMYTEYVYLLSPISFNKLMWTQVAKIILINSHLM